MRLRFLLLSVAFVFFIGLEASQDIASMEKRLQKLVDHERSKYRLKPLETSSILVYYARQHSQNMAQYRVDFGHGGFEKRASAIAEKSWVSSVGENVAYCYLMEDPLKAAVEGWMKSYSHRKNILGDYELTGVAIAYSRDGRCYMTQLFAKRVESGK